MNAGAGGSTAVLVSAVTAEAVKKAEEEKEQEEHGRCRRNKSRWEGWDGSRSGGKTATAVVTVLIAGHRRKVRRRNLRSRGEGRPGRKVKK